MADSKGNTLWHQVYEPFGITHLSKGNKSNNKFLFAGKEKDDTGLSYFGARYYSENQGRFMSPDPVKVQPDNPNTFNRYLYANNNPYKYVDPDGRLPTNNPYIDVSEAVFGAVVGGIAGYTQTGTFRGAIIGATTGSVTAYLANPLSAWSSGMVAASGGYRAAQAASVFTKLSTYTGGAATGNYLLTGDFNLSSALFGAVGGMLGGKFINPMAMPVESNIHFMLNSSYSYLTGELMSRTAGSITSNWTNSPSNSYNSSFNSTNLDSLSGGNMNMGSMCYASKGDVVW